MNLGRLWRSAACGVRGELVPRLRRPAGACEAAGARWLSSRQPTGIDSTMVNQQQKSKEVAEQVRLLSRKTWGQWAKDHQDELLVVLLSSMFLVTTLRLQRQKGEALEDKKAYEERIAELEDKIERIKAEVKASVEAGAEGAAAELGLGAWGGRAKKAEELQAAVMRLVRKGIAKANEAPEAGAVAAAEIKVAELAPPPGESKPPPKMI